MRGSIRRRYKSSWSLILHHGYEHDPVTGKRKRLQSWVTFHGTKRQAETKLAELIRDTQHGEFVASTRRTLIEWLREWFTLSVEPNNRPNTIVRYRGIIENHISKATIATMPIQKVRASHIEAYYQTIPVGSRGVHHTVLRRALKKAVRDRVLVRNPIVDLEQVPRRERTTGEDDDAVINCWTASEARLFLAKATASGLQAAAFFSLALDSGMRKGELCGLRWADVDLEAGSVRVVQQLITPGPDPVYGPPKGSRPRTIELTGQTIEWLKAHKREQAALKMRNRIAYRDLGLVFAKDYGDMTKSADRLGLPLQANNMAERWFAPLVKAAEVKAITFHGMRHTCATLLLLAGEPVHNVSQRLGHSDPSITMKVYAHALKGDKRRTAATIANILHG